MYVAHGVKLWPLWLMTYAASALHRGANAHASSTTAGGGTPGIPTITLASSMSGPVLGLWGNEDAYPTPAQVDEIEQLLKDAGKPYEFHRYDNAGHAFFMVDRASFRPEVAIEGWATIWRFLGANLGA